MKKVDPFFCRVGTFVCFSRADDEIGLLATVRPLAVVFIGPLICAFGDKHGIQQKVSKNPASRPTPHPRTKGVMNFVLCCRSQGGLAGVRAWAICGTDETPETSID